ncbi:TRAP transporter large permease [Ramlibacter sp. AW1]|uniref:TRAP transporter large permease protein n=1 Tax=Ramlibacter aurantiacus TaxID=2801330 RepID=A0A936ZKD7_9BURK|nr:TRAP transporter large permease [Ramlibacter aurantiacus]MBL0422949.1 TRAP transporter large permease [Ramlibacter aurantiacus]
MSPLEIGGLGIAALFALIVLHVPIGFAMLIVGVGGLALQTSWGPAFTLIATETSNTLSSVDIATVPLFILMGTFAAIAGFPKDLYEAAGAFLGHRRGGLAYATMGGCAAFGVVCGSSTATAATFGKAALPEMRARGYSPAFATGTIAAGGALKSLIPPSVVMILYCIATKVFIFDLFTAAIVPALLAIAINLAVITVLTRLNPHGAPVVERASWAGRRQALRRAMPALLLMLAVFGGLYSGIFTVNEAASVAAVLALLCTVLRRRLTWHKLLEGLRESASATAMLYMILIGALVFTYFISYARIPEALAAAVEALTLPPVAVIFVMIFIYIVLGAVFDEISAMLITLPFVLPIVTGFGYDPVWWGIINVVVVELGMIIPPIGIIVFILHGMAPDIPMRTIFKGVAPFVIADLLLLAVLVLFPSISLWLPRVLAG